MLDLSFYPNERGPYNFDTKSSSFSAGVNPDGSLRSPETRWGGIMRNIQTSDFETANIEFIEFWVMDPFINDEDENHQGGDLYFNLGDISEDILKDSRKSFEQGLPTSAVVTNIDTTVWGRVSTLQSLVNAFDNDPQSRLYQDVGLDGLIDDDERVYFSDYLNSLNGIVDQGAFLKAQNDPSSDDFNYFRDSDYDRDEVGILERYKNYNGPEGNSTTTELSPEPYPTSATTLPDIEDINSDNTLNEYERYYQYKVSIRRENMYVGQNYITDIREATVKLKNGIESPVRWYQFKIPIKSPDNVFGNISDFKSIRFMRMFLRNFSEPVTLRFGALDLVRADWRRYTRDLGEVGAVSPNSNFDVSAVNIEENGSRLPINYVLPPEIDRVIDPANPQLRQLNEQSMVLKVTELEQGDARGAYKNLYMDFRMYNNIRLEVHAEEIEGYPVKDEELTFFIRLGSDLNLNYYEYEVPLKLTPEGRYNSDIEAHRYTVWPDENRINLPLELFTNAKLVRNSEVRRAGSNISTTDIFEIPHSGWNNDKNLVKIKGNPSLGNVENIMVGIRNKKGPINTGARSVEVWINELRLTDFDESGGWAANARLSTRLADLGSITLAGRTRSAGFGSLDKSINNRELEDLVEFDISSSLDLGRFLPEKAGMRIPMYFGYSRSSRTPKYDPVNTDVELKESLDRAESQSERDSIKFISQDLITRKSINFTNVKYEPQTASTKVRLYDPQNFAVTYSYNEIFRRNINTEYHIDKTYRGMFSYNFSNVPKAVSPFKKVKFLQKGPLKLFGDFSFYPMPAQISFRTDLYRRYNEKQTRNITNPALVLPKTFEKDFLWNRYFDLRYNLTRTLKFDFSSRGTSRIDEPEGRINKNDDDYTWKRDSILNNLWEMGRPTMYNHNVNITYQLPLNRIKALNFMSATGRYQSTYNWAAGPQTADTINLGNIIENSQNWSVTGNINMSQIYNKVPYFKEVNSKFRRTGRTISSRGGNTQQRRQPVAANRQQQAAEKEVKFEKKNLKLTANKPSTINHKLSTDKVTAIFLTAEGTVIRGKQTVLDKNRIQFTPNATALKATVTVTGKKVEKNILKEILDFSTRVLLGVQNISVSFNNAGGTVLPGYMPQPKLFGGGKYLPDQNSFAGPFAETYAPGVPFLFGWQDRNFPQTAANNGWLTTDPLQNMPVIINKNERINIRSTIEPIPDLRIDLTGDRSISKNISEYYAYDTNTGSFESQSMTERGNFSMSVNTWGTAFFAIGKGDVHSSEAFENFKTNRITIAKRLASKRGRVPIIILQFPTRKQVSPMVLVQHQ